MGLGGLEPPTSSLSGKRSNRLSYRPALAVYLSSDVMETTCACPTQRTEITSVIPHVQTGPWLAAEGTGSRGRSPPQMACFDLVVGHCQVDAPDEGGHDVVQERTDRRQCGEKHNVNNREERC